jgi:hypothetical protein
MIYYAVVFALVFIDKDSFRLHVEEPVSSNAKKVENGPLGSFERDAFYPWCSINQVYKRGPALIFSQAHDQLTNDFETALKELEFCPLLKKLYEAEGTLGNSKLL